MALWGNKDKVTTSNTQASTVAVVANGLVTGVATKFEADLQVGDYISNGGHKYFVESVTSNTQAQVVSATAAKLTTVSISQANAAYAIQEAPKSVVESESLAGASSGDGTKIVGVDTTEAGVGNTTQGFAHAGWVRRTVGSGDRAGRIQTEVLVAMSSISGDAPDDDEAPDS